MKSAVQEYKEQQGERAFLLGIGCGSTDDHFINGWIMGFYKHKARQDAVIRKRSKGKKQRKK